MAEEGTFPAFVIDFLVHFAVATRALRDDVKGSITLIDKVYGANDGFEELAKGTRSSSHNALKASSRNTFKASINKVEPDDDASSDEAATRKAVLMEDYNSNTASLVFPTELVKPRQVELPAIESDSNPDANASSDKAAKHRVTRTKETDVASLPSLKEEQDQIKVIPHVTSNSLAKSRLEHADVSVRYEQIREPLFKPRSQIKLPAIDGYSDPEWAADPTCGPPTKYHFEVFKGSMAITTVDLSQKTQFLGGRSSTEAKLQSGVDVIDLGSHTTLSRMHAVVQHAADGSLWLFDMSRHGIKVDQQVIESKCFFRLELGMVVQFGHSLRTYEVRQGSPPVDISTAWSTMIESEDKDPEMVANELAATFSTGSPNTDEGQLPLLIAELITTQMVELVEMQEQVHDAQTRKFAVSAVFATVDMVTDMVTVATLRPGNPNAGVFKLCICMYTGHLSSHAMLAPHATLICHTMCHVP